jgi:hypothetical protein
MRQLDLQPPETVEADRQQEYFSNLSVEET